MIISTMLTAINRVHIKNGPFVSDGGYEYNLVLIAIVLALTEIGPGSPSIDEARGSQAHGSKWALLSLIMGAIGAAGAHAVAEAAPAPEPAPAEPPPSPEAPESPAPATSADPAQA
jgi:putative oxidoreductase